MPIEKHLFDLQLDDDVCAVIIDSTDKKLGIALLKGKETFVYLGGDIERRHTAEILTALDQVLASAKLSISDITVIGCVIGPGSFTGIRIGVATCNAIAYANSIKIIEITSLETLICDRDRGLALIDCKNNNYYALIKDGTLTYTALNIDEIKNIPFTPVYRVSFDAKKACATFINKYKNQNFSKISKPFYIKKSSADGSILT
ncbi:MAG: tRNA (adenosine(37)-N6)-threonylcarbamoyltransferase complex dimerization subunit type 1 TsaB [Christensenellaceae bacterium]|jgi:tRNA threonylcarbamoyl adenosine modification protein YeaZ|nr:tRNA (adenosine(37)-N6)-threonylcarbamoyltransferase complex dimerization subunit type 1 TsaB [Christensenellaceae bacterium]